MATSPDIRLACGQTEPTKPIRIYGGCGQQFDTTHQSIKIKRNATKMKDYASGSSAWLDPFPTAEARTAPDCSPYNNGDPFFFVCGDGINGNVWCFDQNFDDTFFQPCATGSGTQSFSVGDFHNCYYQTDETESFTKCRNLGFKNLYASKGWSGKYAYNSRMNNQRDWFDWCCGCAYHNYDATADQTKYLSISATSTVTQHTEYFCCGPSCNCGAPCDTCGPCGGSLPACGTFTCPPDPTENCDSCTDCTANGSNDWSGTGNASAHVDIYGNLYSDGCSSGSGCPGSYPQCCGGSTPAPDIGLCEQWWAGYAFNLTGEANTDINNIVDQWCGFLVNQGQPDVITGDGTSWHIEYHNSYDCTDECGNIVSSHTYSRLSMDISTAGTLSVTMNGLKPNGFNSSRCASDGFCPTVTQTFSETFTYSGTSYVRNLTVSGIGSWSFNDVYTEHVEGSLASPYTSKQVYDEIVNLLATWDFGDELIYPWREDASVTKGPYVSHDEGVSTPFVPACSNSISWTGTVKGRPGPEGIDRIWDPTHPNYCTCDSTVQPGCIAFFIKDYGDWSTSCGVPRATQWLNLYESNNMMQGAFVGSNFFWTFPGTCNSAGPQPVHDDVMWACKYAEIIFPKQSYNYARPCGADRYQVSQSTDRCVVGTSGGTLTLEPNGPSSEIAANDYVWVCGTTDWDGAWLVDSVGGGGYSITLKEPRIISASLAPTVPISDCGTGMVAQLRWANLQPAICGKLYVTNATATAPVTITLEEGSYLGNGDTIFIEGAVGANINGYWAVQTTGTNTQFVLIGSDGISSSYQSNTGLAKSPFAADWKWNDTTGKNEFSILKWLYNNRDVSEYYRVKGTVDWNGGLSRCDGVSICPGPTVPAEPRPFQNACGMPQVFQSLTCDTECLPYNACRPVAAYFSPNTGSDHFDKTGSAVIASQNYGFYNPGMDTQYGTLWQAMVKQSIDDPLFQPPPCPCTPVFNEGLGQNVYQCDCNMTEDAGFCQGDTVTPCEKIYPHADQFEARCSPPEGAPSMPPGIHIGCLETSQFTNANCPEGNICYPPFSPNTFPYGETCNPYLVFPWAIPWTLLTAEESCVCSSGRFADNYRRNGISCNQDIFPPP